MESRKNSTLLEPLNVEELSKTPKHSTRSQKQRTLTQPVLTYNYAKGPQLPLVDLVSAWYPKIFQRSKYRKKYIWDTNYLKKGKWFGNRPFRRFRKSNEFPLSLGNSKKGQLTQNDSKIKSSETGSTVITINLYKLKVWRPFSITKVWTTIFRRYQNLSGFFRWFFCYL